MGSHFNDGVYVALFTRAWIEIEIVKVNGENGAVALFTRAWIEIFSMSKSNSNADVALFTRAWIEIHFLFFFAK